MRVVGKSAGTTKPGASPPPRAEVPSFAPPDVPDLLAAAEFMVPLVDPLFEPLAELRIASHSGIARKRRPIPKREVRARAVRDMNHLQQVLVCESNGSFRPSAV